MVSNQAKWNQTVYTKKFRVRFHLASGNNLTHQKSALPIPGRALFLMQGITQQPQYTKCRRWSESEARPCSHRPRSCAGTLSGVVGGVEVDKCTTLNDDLRRTILVSAVHTVDQKVVAIQIAEWLAGEGTAVDDEGTLLNLHSSTAAVIVAAVDGEGCTIPDVDAIAAVLAGINAAVLARIDGGVRIDDKGAEVHIVVAHVIGGDDLLLQIQRGGLGDDDAGRSRILNVVGLDILGNSHDAAVGQSLLQFRNVHHRVSGVLVIGVVEAVALHGVLGGVDGDGDAVNRLVHVVVTGPSRPKWIQRPHLRVVEIGRASCRERV